MKCTEERPACVRCTSTGRKCDGYPTLPVSRRDLVTPENGRSSILVSYSRLLDPFDHDGKPNVQFEYFCHRVIPQTNYHLQSSFWDRLLLQLYHREPCIRHAVVAVSLLHQDWELNGMTSCCADRNALFSHQRAMRHANDLLGRAHSSAQPNHVDIVAILVVCILFICFEHGSGKYRTSIDHLQNGLQIVSRYYPACLNVGTTDNALAKSPEIAALVDVMQRLEFMTATFMNARFSTQYPPSFSDARFVTLPSTFESRDEARRHLFNLVKWHISLSDIIDKKMVTMEQSIEGTPESFRQVIEHEKQHFVQVFGRWEKLFLDLFQNNEPLGASVPAPCSFVWVIYLSTKTMVNADFAGDEMAYDAYTELFEDLLQRARTMLPTKNVWFSLEDGIISLLFLVARRCRHPRLRREAISLLASRNGREGVWECHKMSLLALKLVSIEEEGIPNVTAPEDIPYTARVRSIKTQIMHQEGKVFLDVWQPTGLADPAYRVKREVIYL